MSAMLADSFVLASVNMRLEMLQKLSQELERAITDLTDRKVPRSQVLKKIRPKIELSIFSS